MFKKILNFLFGKKADIFNDKGEVCHKLPEEKWKAWNERYSDKQTADWRTHKGTQAPK